MMATQSKFNEQRGTKQFLVTVAVLSAILVTSACSTVLPASQKEASSSQQLVVVNDRVLPATIEQETDTGVSQGFEADAARYTAMAEFYATQQSDLQRGFEADAARYTAMAEFYATQQADPQRALEAEAARYSGMATFYTRDSEAGIPTSSEIELVQWNRLHHPGR